MKVSPQSMSLSLYALHNNMRGNMQRALFAEGAVLLNDFKDRAPVDSELFRKSWVLSRNRFASGNIFTGIVISNRAPYAYWMEFGAPEGKFPWFYPNPKKKRTGKLVRRNGRVWAGGRNPGHSKTIGGAIGPVLVNNNRRLNKLAKLTADSIIGGLK